jgi:hypothetical protein
MFYISHERMFSTMNTFEEKNINPINEMVRIADNLLNLKSYGFELSYQDEKSSKLVFQSEWCKISLTWEGWDYGVGNSMQILYGRLHASNDKNMMIWNGDECRCWHRVEYPLHFLDKQTPVDVARLRLSHPTTDPFYEAEITEKFYRRQPEWLAEMHSAVWQQYGQQLFELFDLRRPDLWQQYQQFLKEVYDITGRKPRPGPPMDKVC